MVCVMKKTDARKLTQEQLTDLRKRGVAAVQAGESPETVAKVLGIHRTTIYGWLANYRNGGWHQLDARKRGGRKPKLDAKDMQWLYKAITEGKRPQPEGTWNTRRVSGLNRSLRSLFPSEIIYRSAFRPHAGYAHIRGLFHPPPSTRERRFHVLSSISI